MKKPSLEFWARDGRQNTCIYLSFLLRIHGKKLKKDKEGQDKLIGELRIGVGEDDLDSTSVDQRLQDFSGILESVKSH